MDRRSTIKNLLAGSLTGGALLSSCDKPVVNESNQQAVDEPAVYGRTEEEKAHDLELNKVQFFSEEELDTISCLCDLILPKRDGYYAASDAQVAEFIEFMVKDMPKHQLPLRGGIMWLNNFARNNFKDEFVKLKEDQQKEILDQIAWPEEVAPELSQGAKFFDLIRGLTLTGFYTSKQGIEELEYKGNTPNVWDGVPEDVLREHGLSYDKEWLAKCIDQKTRTEIAKWDEDGNLIT